MFKIVVRRYLFNMTQNIVFIRQSKFSEYILNVSRRVQVYKRHCNMFRHYCGALTWLKYMAETTGKTALMKATVRQWVTVPSRYSKKNPVW